MAEPALRPVLRHADGIARCPWAGTDPLYMAYHDDEWGVPEFDDRALFEKLILDGFQAGLSWITILRKRDAFRLAFDGFDPEIIARYDEAKFDALMQNAGIIRNGAKIRSSASSARAWLGIQEKQGFSNYLWGFFDGKPQVNRWRDMGEVPPRTPLSETIARDLRQRGFNFCGPTIIYAFCQAVGMVNDHLLDCACHARCQTVRRT
ncbi:MAG: DNA-3-methyladenine glycosylase I [Hyphomicrobiales bacterium]|nr:DNA-3-methyladenine glycosylase I [Hyphomicrobiales bacterium]